MRLFDPLGYLLDALGNVSAGCRLLLQGGGNGFDHSADPDGRLIQRLDDLTASLNSSIDTETSKIAERLGDHEKNHKDLDRRFQMWLNRGLGGWLAFALVIGALQFIGIRWLNAVDAERTALVEKVQRLSSRVADLENRVLQGDGSSVPYQPNRR